MSLKSHMLVFLDDETGAVTVDWVVLTAAIVGLGIAVMISISDGTTELADDVNHQLEHHASDMAIDYPLHQ